MRLLAILLLFLLPIGAVWAQGDIHRCVGANGVPVFTDRVCSDINAAPVMPPAPASTAIAPANPSQPLPVLCASDIGQLKQAVIDAFAARNPNRLAGLMLWDGDGQETVVADIRLFNRLMVHPLIGVRAGPSSASSTAGSVDPAGAAPSPSPTQSATLSVQTESDDGSGATQETGFDVVHHAGCLWLHPQE
jgi:hypothetical protein